jgi:hypothetical protein
MRFVRLTLLMVAVALGACESCDGCSSENADSEQEGPRGPFLVEHGGPVRSDAEAPPPPPEAKPREPGKVARAVETFAEGMKQLAEAMNAGIEAETGDTHCERALSGMKGMIAHVAARTPEGRTPPSPPNGLLFMQLCESLEVEAQRCMMLSYYRDHGPECEQVKEELPPEVVERIQRVLNLN